MNMRAVKAVEVMQLAESFRTRAAEATDDRYHAMMLRTAAELEELAGSLTRRPEFIMIDDSEDDGELDDA